jgi:hypothetical protein
MAESSKISRSDLRKLGKAVSLADFSDHIEGSSEPAKEKHATFHETTRVPKTFRDFFTSSKSDKVLGEKSTPPAKEVLRRSSMPDRSAR